MVIIVLGARTRRSQQPDLPGGEPPSNASNDDESDILDSLSQEDLDKLMTALEALEFEDLGGLSEDGYQNEEQETIGAISQEDLDELKEALESLEFEDLGGLTG
jgi:hypothetical protein